MLTLRWGRGWVEFTAPIEETLRALDDVVANGKVRYVALSDVPARVAAQAQTITGFRGWAPITALQLEYSLLERTSEGELLSMAQQLGIGGMPWGPLKGGKLSGKYTRDGGGEGGRFATMAALEGQVDEREWSIIDAVAEVAGELGVGSAEVALARVVGRPGVSSTLIGARTLR